MKLSTIRAAIASSTRAALVILHEDIDKQCVKQEGSRIATVEIDIEGLTQAIANNAMSTINMCVDLGDDEDTGVRGMKTVRIFIVTSHHATTIELATDDREALGRFVSDRADYLQLGESVTLTIAVAHATMKDSQ